MNKLILSLCVLLTACGGGSSVTQLADRDAVAVCFRDASDDDCADLKDGRFAHAWEVNPVGAVVASDSGDLAYVKGMANELPVKSIWVNVR